MAAPAPRCARCARRCPHPPARTPARVRPALAALVLPAALLALFGFEWARGTPHAVRGAWGAWAPAALALAGVLGPALLASGRLKAPTARAVVLAALGGLVTYVALVVLVPLGPGESTQSRLYPGLDTALAGALVTLAALGIRRALVVVTWALAAIVLARAAGVVASALATRQLGPAVATGALFWLAAATLAAALGLLRFSSRRTTRA